LSPIVPIDLEFLLSQPAAKRGMEDTSRPDQSLGGFAAITPWDDQSADLFPDITGADNERGILDVRCLFVYNKHNELPLMDATIWIERQAEGGAYLQFSVDPTSAQPAKGNSAQALTWGGNGEPAALNWHDNPGRRNALRLGTIPAGHVKAFWIKRQAHRLPALQRDFFLLRIQGDTAQ